MKFSSMVRNPVVSPVRVRSVITRGLALSSAMAMVLAVAVAPASAATARQNSRTVVVVGTGRPLVDRVALQRAVRRVGPDGTVQLVGTFNLRGCVACVLIRDGITVEGVNRRGRPAMATLVGGSFPVVIAVRDRGPGTGSGNMTLQRLHFTDQLLNAVYFFKTVAETRFLDNSVTDLNYVIIGDDRRAVRSPVVAAQFWPNGAGPGRDEILQRFPAFARLVARFGGEFHLQGNITYSRNYFDLLSPAVSFGLENTIAMFGDYFSKITIDHNYLASHGETIELEYGRNPDGVRNIEHNIVVLDAIEDVENNLFGPGHPAAISLEASQARAVNIVDNDVITFGGNNGSAIGGGTANEATKWRIIGNRIQTAGQIPFPGGFHGLDPFFTGSSMINTVYKNNTITGYAKYGFWFDTDNPFDPISHGNTMGPNDFSGFTATSGTAVVFGPKTHNNTVNGPLPGGVIDLGTDNVINP
jgi:hypothetical protein